MSQENVELVRRTIDALNRREIDQAAEAAHGDFEADWSNSIAPHGGVYRGRERARDSSRPSSRRGTSSAGSLRRSSRWTSPG